MKSVNLRKWLSVAALAFVMAVLSLQFQSARAQYGYTVSPYAGINATMIEKGGFLYVMRGDMIFKIREKDLKVERSISLTYPDGVVPTATPYLTPGEGTPRFDGTPTETPYPTPTMTPAATFTPVPTPVG